MANEITAYGSLQVVNGLLSVLEDSGTLSITQSAKEAFTSTVACTTSDTAISISGVIPLSGASCETLGVIRSKLAQLVEVQSLR